MLKRFVLAAALVWSGFGMSGGVAAQTAQAPSTAAKEPHDPFYFLGEINKASVVMLKEVGIIPPALASRIAGGIETVLAEARRPGADRSSDYLKFEPRLIAAAGPDASMVHAGRSRQDIRSTYERMILREKLLAAIESLDGARANLLALAGRNRDTIIPAYTHGVQAQPTTAAHYLLALAAALDRSSDRLAAAYAQVNRSPLGAAALATSGFPLDRNRLAALLGFDGLVENSYDANHVSPVDSSLDTASALGIAAVHIGQFAQDMTTQYAQPHPWFLLSSGPLTGVSSIMPQKRNPMALTSLRQQSSVVIGEMQTAFLLAHNTDTGLFDYRGVDHVPADKAAALFRLFGDVLGSLVVDRDRALAEVDADYSTMTEVADTLMQKAGVPFRIGHHFASELTDYGRSHGLTPKQIPYAEARRIYREATGQDLPLSEAEFAEAISPEYMVSSRRGIGGTQPDEIERMLREARDRLASDEAWLRARRDALARAQSGLQSAFSELASARTEAK